MIAYMLLPTPFEGRTATSRDRKNDEHNHESARSIGALEQIQPSGPERDPVVAPALLRNIGIRFANHPAVLSQFFDRMQIGALDEMSNSLRSSSVTISREGTARLQTHAIRPSIMRLALSVIRPTDAGNCVPFFSIAPDSYRVQDGRDPMESQVVIDWPRAIGQRTLICGRAVNAQGTPISQCSVMCLGELVASDDTGAFCLIAKALTLPQRCVMTCQTSIESLANYPEYLAAYPEFAAKSVSFGVLNLGDVMFQAKEQLVHGRVYTPIGPPNGLKVALTSYHGLQSHCKVRYDGDDHFSVLGYPFMGEVNLDFAAYGCASTQRTFAVGDLDVAVDLDAGGSVILRWIGGPLGIGNIRLDLKDGLRTIAPEFDQTSESLTCQWEGLAYGAYAVVARCVPFGREVTLAHVKVDRPAQELSVREPLDWRPITIAFTSKCGAPLVLATANILGAPRPFEAVAESLSCTGPISNVSLWIPVDASQITVEAITEDDGLKVVGSSATILQRAQLALEPMPSTKIVVQGLCPLPKDVEWQVRCTQNSVAGFCGNDELHLRRPQESAILPSGGQAKLQLLPMVAYSLDLMARCRTNGEARRILALPLSIVRSTYSTGDANSIIIIADERSTAAACADPSWQTSR